MTNPGGPEGAWNHGGTNRLKARRNQQRKEPGGWVEPAEMEGQGTIQDQRVH